VGALDGSSGTELVIEKLRTTKSNAEFLKQMAKAPAS